MLDSTFNQQKADAFAEGLMDILNKGAIALSISLGHRTGLFDAMKTLPPTTSAQIAEAAELDERYVREWLGAMVTGRVVCFNPEKHTYRLADEHAAYLTRDAAPNNLAALMQYIPLLGSVEDKIVACFKTGGGVPYSEFPRFHEVMAEDSGQSVLPALIDLILPLAPGIVEELAAGIDVLDVGCGSGRALILMAKTFPNSRFTGYDFSEEGIRNACREAEADGLANIRFEVKDVATIGELENYDLITAFDAIHDQARPAVVLREICNALRPDGTFLMQDIDSSSHVNQNLDHPLGPMLYTVSTMHCMTVSLALDGDGLGTMWGRELAVEMLKTAGFKHVCIRNLSHDIQNCYYIVTKK